MLLQLPDLVSWRPEMRLRKFERKDQLDFGEPFNVTCVYHGSSGDSTILGNAATHTQRCTVHSQRLIKKCWIHCGIWVLK